MQRKWWFRLLAGSMVGFCIIIECTPVVPATQVLVVPLFISLALGGLTVVFFYKFLKLIRKNLE